MRLTPISSRCAPDVIVEFDHGSGRHPEFVEVEHPERQFGAWSGRTLELASTIHSVSPDSRSSARTPAQSSGPTMRNRENICVAHGVQHFVFRVGQAAADVVDIAPHRRHAVRTTAVKRQIGGGGKALFRRAPSRQADAKPLRQLRLTPRAGRAIAVVALQDQVSGYLIRQSVIHDRIPIR